MQNTNSRHKRFFYPAGLISLIFLPALCIFYLYKHKAFETLRVIEIVWWSEDWGKFSEQIQSFKIYPKRNYIDINLTDDDAKNKIKLDYAQLQIRKLISNQDTTQGVHINFDDESKYWSFVRAIDICKIEKAKVFIAYQNDLWIFNHVTNLKPKSNRVKVFRCGTGTLGKFENEIANENHQKIYHIFAVAKSFWLSGLLFIFMTILTIKKVSDKL